jgi:hypothetical protein
MIASTASALEIENTIFAIVSPMPHLIARSEEDWRVSFTKFVTSVSGAGIGIAEGPQPTGDLTVSRGESELPPEGDVSSACAVHPTITRKLTGARRLADMTIQQNLEELLRRVAAELDHLADDIATPEADCRHSRNAAGAQPIVNRLRRTRSHAYRPGWPSAR